MLLYPFEKEFERVVSHIEKHRYRDYIRQFTLENGADLRYNLEMLGHVGGSNIEIYSCRDQNMAGSTCANSSSKTQTSRGDEKRLKY